MSQWKMAAATLLMMGIVPLWAANPPATASHALTPLLMKCKIPLVRQHIARRIAAMAE